MRKFFSTQKIKIKAFLKKWKAENLIIKDCDKRTPLHCKVTKILSWLCIILMFFIWLSAFPASAADTGGTALPVENLTGTTWVVDLKSEDFNNIGIFDVYGAANYPVTQSALPIQEFTTIAFGYNYNEGQYTPMVGSCACVYFPSDYYNYWFDQGDGTVCLTFRGGDDVENTSLISALVTYGEQIITEPDLPVHDTFFIPEGYYGLSDLAGELAPPIENTTVNLEKSYDIPVQLFYTNGLVKQYNSFGYMLTSYTDEDNYSADFVVHLLDTDLPTRVASFVATNGVSSFNFYGGVSHIYIPEDVTIIIDDTMDSDFRYLFTYIFALDSSFIPDEPDIPDLPPYNMWAYFLEMIIEALKVNLFGYFSIWDIFVTFCGISLVIWFLKLLAGG